MSLTTIVLNKVYNIDISFIFQIILHLIVHIQSLIV